MKTHIVLYGRGGELARISLSDRDATGEALAAAAVELVQQTGSLSAGDRIEIIESD